MGLLLRLPKLLFHFFLLSLKMRLLRRRATRSFYRALRREGVPRALAKRLAAEYRASYPLFPSLMRQIEYSRWGRFAR